MSLVRQPRPAGVTLVEMLVVLAVLGIMAGMVGLAWQPGSWVAGDPQLSHEAIASVRRQALESGKPVQAVVTLDGRPVQVRAMPDGRVLGAEQLNVNPLSGVVDARHPR